MNDSILLENARREIAKLGGIVEPEPQPNVAAATAFPHAPIALPHWAAVTKR